MASAADPSDLVEGAYAAAVDGGLWEGWTDSLRRALGGISATFGVTDARTGTVRAMIPIGASQNVIEDYLAGRGRDDPQLHQAGSVQRSCLYTSEEYVDLGDRATADYWKWQSAVGGFEHHITATTILGDEGLRGVVSVHLRVGEGPATREQRRIFGAIFPDLRRALQLGFQHTILLTNTYWEGVASREPGAAMLLDEGGRAMRLNLAAEMLLTTNDGLGIRAGKLVCATPESQHALDALVEGAIARKRARAGAMQVPRRACGRPHVVTVYPLVCRQHLLASCEARALVRIVDPGPMPADHSASLMAMAFRLTPREAELARLLAADHSVESAAATMTIAIATARLHLHRLFEKTGACRQSELIRLIGRLR